jgi:hypothetical protein
MMKKVLLVSAVLVMLLALSATAANKIAYQGSKEVTINLSNDETIAAVAMALSFGKPGEDVFCKSVDFAGSRVDYINNDQKTSGIKQATIDNVNKTILLLVIPFSEKRISAGSGSIAKLNFEGSVSPKLSSAVIKRQDGEISLEGIALLGEKSNKINFSTSSTPVLPSNFSLSQNYPNPFNPETNISYTLPEAANVRLVIFNILGQKVKTLVNEKQAAGYQTVKWDGTDDIGNHVGSGIYFYKITAGNYSDSKKMTLLK